MERTDKKMSDIHILENDLDLKQNLNIYTICKQFDTLHLVLSVYDDGLVSDLTNYNVRLKAMKFDNIPLIQENNCNINGNVVTIIANEQLTTTSGKTLIELQFIHKTTLEKKATFNLVLNVVASTLEVNRTISTATYTLLQELENKLDQAGDFLENVNEAIEANNELKIGITTATTLKTNLDDTINTGNTTNSELEASITIANTSKINLENENIKAVGNISDLTTKNSQASSNINALTDKNTEATSNINNLTVLNQSATTLEQNLQTLTTENNNATQNINDLNNKNSTAEINKTNLDGANTQAEANIDALNQIGDITGIASDIYALKTEVETARNGEVSLDVRLDKNDILVASHTTQLSEKANQNEIINGNLDLWQRGTSVTNPSNATYLADRFKISKNITGTAPTNIVHSRQQLISGDIANSFYYYRINVDGAGVLNADDYYLLSQAIENGTRKFCGVNKKVTLSFCARSSIVNKKLGVYFSQIYGSGGTPSTPETINGGYFNLTSNWAKYTITVSTNTLIGKTFGSDNNDDFRPLFAYAYGVNTASKVGDTVAETFRGAGYIDIAQIKLESGDKATPFVPRLYGEELALCQRYFLFQRFQGIANTTTNIHANQALVTSMRSNPTVYIIDNGIKANSDGATISTIGSTITLADNGASFVGIIMSNAVVIGGVYRWTANLDSEIY